MQTNSLTSTIFQVEVFHNDLVDRKILVKRDLKHGAPMIKRQICKVGLNLALYFVVLLQYRVSLFLSLSVRLSLRVWHLVNLFLCLSRFQNFFKTRSISTYSNCML